MGFITGMDAKRQFALSRILRAVRHGRQNHTAYALLQSLFGGIQRNVVRENAIGHIRQVKIVGLGSSPGQYSEVVWDSSYFSVARYREV